MVFVQGLCVQKETLLVSCVIIMYNHDHIIIIILIVLNNNRDRDHQQREGFILLSEDGSMRGTFVFIYGLLLLPPYITYSEVSGTLPPLHHPPTQPLVIINW